MFFYLQTARGLPCWNWWSVDNCLSINMLQSYKVVHFNHIFSNLTHIENSSVGLFLYTFASYKSKLYFLLLNVHFPKRCHFQLFGFIFCKDNQFVFLYTSLNKSFCWGIRSFVLESDAKRTLLYTTW